MDAFGGYTEYATRVIADRRGCPRDDLMSVLVHAEVDGDRLDDDSILHESLLILIGGDETTRHVMSGGMYQLLAEPDRWERLKADRELIVPAVEEMLRWVTPDQEHGRTATRTVEFHGKTIEAGQKLLLLYPSANRDDDRFPDADTFDMERSPNDHVAFGFGTHFCLGSSLARLELRGAVRGPRRPAPRPPPRRDRRGARPPRRELRERLRGDAGHVHPDRPPRLTADLGGVASVVVADRDHAGALDDRHAWRGVDDDLERLGARRGRVGHDRDRDRHLARALGDLDGSGRAA